MQEGDVIQCTKTHNSFKKGKYYLVKFNSNDVLGAMVGPYTFSPLSGGHFRVIKTLPGANVVEGDIVINHRRTYNGFSGYTGGTYTVAFKDDFKHRYGSFKTEESNYLKVVDCLVIRPSKYSIAQLYER